MEGNHIIDVRNKNDLNKPLGSIGRMKNKKYNKISLPTFQSVMRQRRLENKQEIENIL